MNRNVGRGRSFSVALVLLGSMVAGAQARGEQPSYSPYAGATDATQVYWGDTHVHSSWSPDAWTFGNRRFEPDTAYRFAAGEEVVAPGGMRVQLRRPLDFLLVSDHSEYMGLFPRLSDEDPVLLSTDTGRRWSDLLAKGEVQALFEEFMDALINNRDVLESETYEQVVWEAVVANADRHNRPGAFTALVGYEWTSMPDAANLHRVLVYRDGGGVADRMPPFSSLDGPTPEALWNFMARYEEETSGRILAIPHNSNMSAGQMFGLEDSDGKPISREYAESRRHWEPIVEATQIKGDSETHPFLSPDDEFADYENWDETAGFGAEPHEDWMYRHEYVRGALGLGLDVAARTGVNPYQFGMIGSTDSHTALATGDEEDFWGKFSDDAPTPERASELQWRPKESATASGDEQESVSGDDVEVGPFKWRYVASGYAAVWARENTRAALFDAMRRRETYATTGPRMVVRFFGGFGFGQADALAPDVARAGYTKGVPMGGELERDQKGRAPSFLLSALRDPDGAHLDRIQIIKGWRDASGELHERIYDVAVSGDRKIGRDGRCREPVGNTVDVSAARYTNAIGASQLIAVWQDPDFDPDLHSFYYARVIEIPKPRWTTYDAARFGVPRPEGVEATTQDRAYTSPIWYAPGDG